MHRSYVGTVVVNIREQSNKVSLVSPVWFTKCHCAGMPDVELGVNDLRRQGKEVVGRHDIIPVVTEEWIRVENAEFHACVQPEEFAATQIIK